MKTAKRTIEVSEKIKAKKPKVEKVNAEKENAENAPITALTEAQLKTVGKITESLDKVSTAFKEVALDLLGNDEPYWAKYLPTYIIPKSRAVQAKYEAFVSELTIAKTDGRKDFKAITTSARELRKDMSEHMRKLRLQKQQAIEVDAD